MAIVHVNGFGTIPVSGDYLALSNGGGGTSTWSRQPGRGAGGYSLRHTNSAGSPSSTYAGKFTLPIGLTAADFSIGVAVNHRAAWSAGAETLSLEIDALSVTRASLATSGANTYAAAAGTSTWNILDGSSTGIGWHWWNFVHKRSATAGYFRVYRDGTLIAEQAPDTTTDYGVVGFKLYVGNANSGAQADIADLIIRNDATLIPDSRVDTLFPTATTAGGWLGSDGNSVDNHLLVNENPDHNAATYVGAATVGALDTYTLADLPSSAGSVHAVQVGARATKSDAGAKTMQTLANANAGTATDPGAGGTVYGLFETDSGAAWTTASVNAMTAGIKVVT